jgi:hypothetical protein
MSRFGVGEYQTFASGRPLHLFDKDFKSSKDSIKACIYEGMPEFDRDVADTIEQTVKSHIAYDAETKEFIRRHGLTQIEAESVLWWTADVSTLSSLNTEDSPYAVYNSHLRSRNSVKIRQWRDYSYYLICALQKLPTTTVISFRGEKKRVTELSKQYVKDHQVQLQILQYAVVASLRRYA